MRRRVTELGRHRFDLARGPLLRVHLLQIGAEDHVLLILTHHVISDAWSSGVLFHDLAAIYGALVAGGAPALPELEVQYADFAAWQREWLQGEELERQAAFWKEALAGAPPLLELPTDHPRPAVQSYRGSRWTRILPRDLSAQLRAFSGAEGCTLFMTLLAAFYVLLSRYSGQDDIVVGTPVAGPAAHGTRAVDRLLRQHAADARRSRRRPDVPRAARAGAAHGARRLGASGPAVREARRSDAAGARPEPLAVVPGDVRPAERAVGGIPDARSRDRPGGDRCPRHREIRPDGVRHRIRRRDLARLRVQHRSLRRSDHRAHERALRDAAARSRRCAGDAHRRSAAARRRRAAAPAARIGARRRHPPFRPSASTR